LVPADLPNPASLTINQTLSDSFLGDGSAANLVFINGDTAQAGAGFLNGLGVSHIIGGSATTRGRQSIASFLDLIAATNAANPNRNYVALYGNAFSVSGDGGTNTGVGAQGALYPLASRGDLKSGATNLLASAMSSTSRFERAPASSTRPT
jgi:hypothetical protein